MSNDALKKIKQTIQKVYDLSVDKGATEGERETAHAAYVRLCAKHQIDLAEFNTQWYWFSTPTSAEERIWGQVCHKVLKTNSYSYRTDTKKRGIELSRHEYAEVSRLYHHYRTLWKQDVADFLTAFIHNHDLFSGVKRDEEQTQKADDLERTMRLIAMMQGMRNDPLPALQLEAVAGG